MPANKLVEVMSDPRFDALALADQAQAMQRAGATEAMVSDWVGRVAASKGLPTVKAESGAPLRPLSEGQQKELAQAGAERTRRLRGTGWSEGPADLQDWTTFGKGVAFAAAPSLAAATLSRVGPAIMPFVPAASQVAYRGAGALEGHRIGKKAAKAVGLPEEVGGIPGAAFGLFNPGTTMLGSLGEQVHEGGGVPTAILALLARKKLGPFVGPLMNLVMKGRAAAGAAEAVAPAVAAVEATAPAAGTTEAAAAELVKRGVFRLPAAAQEWLGTLDPLARASAIQQLAPKVAVAAEGAAPVAAGAARAVPGETAELAARRAAGASAFDARVGAASAEAAAPPVAIVGEPAVGSPAWRAAAFARPNGPTDAEWRLMGGSKIQRAWLESTGRVPGAMTPQDVLAHQARGVPQKTIDAIVERSRWAAAAPKPGAPVTAVAPAAATAPSGVVPGVEQAETVRQLNRLWWGNSANRAAIRDAIKQKFAPEDWNNVLALVMKRNVKIPLVLLGFGGAAGAASTSGPSVPTVR